MSRNPWRYCCARCGSHALCKNTNKQRGGGCPGWQCKGNSPHSRTPVIFDKKTRQWIEQEPRTDTVRENDRSRLA